MSFLNENIWSGRIYSDGWVTAGAGDAPVLEPATGDELIRVGTADLSDIERAAKRAAEAQPEWGPHVVRGARRDPSSRG
jgi:benzaldehyde dehydrogenase (NAD)